jgi:hypothetical protein
MHLQNSAAEVKEGASQLASITFAADKEKNSRSYTVKVKTATGKLLSL